MQPRADSSRALRDIGVTGALVMHLEVLVGGRSANASCRGTLVAYAVGRLDENFTDELDHARQAIDSGAAQTKLEEWIEATQSVG
jgi:anthranilate phosphoribosyltransferase